MAPISLMTTAVSAKAGADSARRSSVVLPLPRNPVSSVVGRAIGRAASIAPRWFHDAAPRRKPAAMLSVAIRRLRQHHVSHNGGACNAITAEEAPLRWLKP